MASNPIEQIRFPDVSNLRRASWQPVYIEPIVGSGERLCIGVLVADDREQLVVPVPSLERLACVYGEAAAALNVSAALALQALGGRLARNGREGMGDLKAPVDGVFVGPMRIGAGDSLEEIARNALVQSASLVEKLVEEEETFEAAERMTNSTRRLERLVQEAVVAVRPELRTFFNKPYRVTPNARPMRLGFVGQRLAANFGLLVPGPLATLVSNAKAKLWDLEQLRTGTQSGMFAGGSNLHFELLVHRVSLDAPEYSDRQHRAVEAAAVELEAEADKVNIRCRPMSAPGRIADYMLLQEAA